MRSLIALMVPAVLLSFGTFACSGTDPESSNDDVETQQNQLVDEGRECSAINKCKPGLACVARVKGGDVGIKGVPAPCEPNDKACNGEGTSSSSSTSGASGSSGWSSSGSTSGSSGWSSSGWSSSGWSSSGGTSGSSGWSSSGATSGSSGWSSSGISSSGGSSGWTSSSSGSIPEVGVCISVR